MLRCKYITVTFIISLSYLLNIIECNTLGSNNDYNRRELDKYVVHLFNKYGSQGVITFEGLEHLMYNLGLGDFAFNDEHTLASHRAEDFKHHSVLPVAIVNQTSDINPQTIQGQSNNLLVELSIHDAKNQSTESVNLDLENEHELMPTNPLSYNSNESYRTNNDKSEQFNRTNTRLNDNETSTINSNIPDIMINDLDPVNQKNVWQDNLFKQIHDSRHRHPRQHGDLTKQCLPPKYYIQLIRDASPDVSISGKFHNHEDNNDHDNDYDESVDQVNITPAEFAVICPALLVQLEEKACAITTKVEKEHIKNPKQSFSMACFYATTSVIIISLCGLVGVAIIPLAKSASYQDVLRFLIAVAIGTLCGDALMHLMPHALVPHEHDHDHNTGHVDSVIDETNDKPVWMCFCAFLAAVFMYALETILPLIGGDEHGHGHSHCSDVAKKPVSPTIVEPTSINTNVELQTASRPRTELNIMLDEKETAPTSYRMSPLAFMVLIGDGLHNVTDGMAIGAAFATDPVTGMATAFAILCHELPHEMGDFAILLQTGVSIRRAIFFNVVSSILSFLGMIFGLVIAEVHTSFVGWIYAGTAGTFLYIAFADLIPEIRKTDSIKVALLNVLGISAGGFIMLLIALHEDKLKILFE